MYVKWLAGLVGIISASCLWAFYGVTLGPIPRSERDGLLPPSMRESYRQHERPRRAESSMGPPHHLGRTSPSRIRLVESIQVASLNSPIASGTSPFRVQIAEGQTGFTHDTVPMTEFTSVALTCHHVETASVSDPSFLAARQTHARTTETFVESAGFGLSRVLTIDPRREFHQETDSIANVELVSLLVHEEPSAYMIQQGPVPVERRPLDSFEELALDRVRLGANLVWSPEQPQRMFGAIRASASCLDCHTQARENDLLGAFTYVLKTPVVQLTAIASK